MAVPTINFGGFVYDDSGDAVSGATVNLFDKNDTASSRASTTTNSSGYWSIAHSTQWGIRHSNYFWFFKEKN